MGVSNYFLQAKKNIVEQPLTENNMACYDIGRPIKLSCIHLSEIVRTGPCCHQYLFLPGIFSRILSESREEGIYESHVLLLLKASPGPNLLGNSIAPRGLLNETRSSNRIMANFVGVGEKCF